MCCIGAGNYTITALAYDNQGGYSELDTVNIIVKGVPAPWISSDIGAVAQRGSAGYKAGIFRIESGGYDFYKAPDAFHYVYQPVAGNYATIIAKVESIGNTHPNALAGLMIRESLSASASFVAAAVNPSGNTNFMWRQSSGTPGYKAVSGTAPRWLKLERSGTSFTSSYSLDGQNWTLMGTTSLTMGSTVYVGLAVTSQNNTLLNTATFSGVYVSNWSPFCTASGSILREYWANVSGNSVGSIPVYNKPSSSSQITSFETPANIGDNYGQRIRGYICAPATGSYTFYLAADDLAELYLSPDDNAGKVQKIASVSAWTNNKQWTKYPSQKSVAITLEKDKKYYIEALHKEAMYGDNLAVGWTTPTNSSIQVIPGSVLSPVVASAARLGNEQEIGRNTSLQVYPNPFEDKVTLATQGKQGSVLITLSDVVGKTYFRKEYELSAQAEVELDFSALQLKAGMHLLKVQTQDGQTQVIKVVKR
jgi:hypothetical protein